MLYFGNGSTVSGRLVGIESAWVRPGLHGFQGFAQEAFGGLGIARWGEVEINRMALFINCPVEIRPFPFYFDVGFIHAPTVAHGRFPIPPKRFSISGA